MYILVIFIILIVSIYLLSRKETFSSAHCPSYCSPFQYPDMYSPHSSCSDPFNWGFTYSTGRCPKLLKPIPRRVPTEN